MLGPSFGTEPMLTFMSPAQGRAPLGQDAINSNSSLWLSQGFPDKTVELNCHTAVVTSPTGNTELVLLGILQAVW